MKNIEKKQQITEYVVKCCAVVIKATKEIEKNIETIKSNWCLLI